MRDCDCGRQIKGKWKYCTECRKTFRKQMTEEGYLEDMPKKTQNSSWGMSSEHKGRKNLGSQGLSNAAEGMGK